MKILVLTCEKYIEKITMICMKYMETAAIYLSLIYLEIIILFFFGPYQCGIISFVVDLVSCLVPKVRHLNTSSRQMCISSTV